MVLTNFELWAADGSSGSNVPLDYNSRNPHTRNFNPFDTRVVPQINPNLNHLSSNGYYGFSYINSAHEMELNDNNNNNNNDIINNNNNNNDIINNNNNNNCTTYNIMENDVNGMNNTFTTTTTPTIQQQQTHASAVNFSSSANATGHAVNNVARCKKRFYDMDKNNDVDHDAAANNCIATNANENYNYGISAKRCRFDDDFTAQYCNDFFQLPSTQIATQSCLMDTDEGFENNNNNIEKCEQKLNPQLQNLSAQQQQQQHNQHIQMQSQQQQQVQHQQEPQQQHLYHHQQHYQDTQFATLKCHYFNHNNNNSSDTLALNNHTCKIDLEKNTENVLKFHNPNPNNPIEKSANDKYQDDNDVANDFKVDDATLFAQLHGGYLHHYDRHFNSTISFSGNYTNEKCAVNHHNLKDENYYEEF